MKKQLRNKIIYFLAIITTAFLVANFSANTNKKNALAQTDWFDPNWPYRVKIPITGSAGAGGNYQIPIKVVYPSNFIENTVSDIGLTGIESSDIDSTGNIYAGKQRQIYKSTDNGKTFTLKYTIPSPANAWSVESFYDGKEVFLVYVDSRDYIFVSSMSTDKLYRSTDHGETFTEALAFTQPDSGWSTSGVIIGLAEDQNHNLYAAEYGNYPSARLWKSTDGGATWTVNKTWDARHLHAVAFNPYNNYLYAVIGEPIYTSTSEARRLYRSKDSGATWQLVEISPDGTMGLSINFLDDWVYLGQDSDFSATTTEYSNIKRFRDNLADNVTTTPEIIWNNPMPDTIVWSITKLNNTLVANIIPKSSGFLTATPKDMRIIESSDGATWTTINRHLVNSLGINAGQGRTLPFLTHHPDRGGQIYTSFTANDGFAISDEGYNEIVPLLEKSQTNFNDVRFTDSDGTTLLSHWMQSYADSKSAILWVKVNADLSSDQFIYLYYGNNSAPSASSGPNTFPTFFDDFSGALSDKWNITANPSTNVTINGAGRGQITGTDVHNANGITSKTAIARPAVLEWDSRSPQYSIYQRTYEGYSSQTLNESSGILIQRVQNQTMNRFLDGNSIALDGGTESRGITNQKIILKPNSGYTLFWDNTRVEDNNSWSGNNQYFSFQSYEANENLSVDNVRARKYISPEPRATTVSAYDTLPGLPTNLIASSASESQISLSWSASSNASQYYLYRSVSASNGYTKIATLSNPSYIDTNVTSGTTYYYKVSAVNSDIESAQTDAVSATPLRLSGKRIVTAQPPPATPTGLIAIAGNSQITLSWNPASSTAQYFIYKKTGNDFYYSDKSTTTQYIVTGLINDIAYYFKVSAVSVDGNESDASEVASSTPYSVPTDLSLTINNNAATTTSAIVTLGLSATNSASMIISNFIDFSGGQWATTTTSTAWTLTSGGGIKTVYAKFRTATGHESQPISANIILDAPVIATPAPKTIQIINATSSIPLFDGDTIKIAANPDVYIIKIVGPKKFKRLILNPQVFTSYGHLKWSKIKVIPQSDLDIFTTSNLVREIKDTKVYQLTPNGDIGTKQWLNMTAAEFTAQNRDWDSIYIINAVDRNNYTTGAEIKSQPTAGNSTSTAAFLTPLTTPRQPAGLSANIFSALQINNDFTFLFILTFAMLAIIILMVYYKFLRA